MKKEDLRSQSVLKERSLGSLIITKSFIFEIEFGNGLIIIFGVGAEYFCTDVLVINVLSISFGGDFDL